ncbi:hypothetical protein [Streptomyces sp. NPDC046712]|uniref:hypothetical protein n=1 Tax=Streptomyces sp. NPDC046712 TaxID=3154802 RepID=UPI0033EA6EAA
MASALYDYESIDDFKTRIDTLISNLNESPAGSKNVAAEPVARTQFGGGGGAWIEASSIFTAYGNVISELKKLSGLLGDCLEGMGIAVIAASQGFSQVDEENRRRMASIIQRTQAAKEQAEREAKGESGPQSTTQDPAQPKPGPTFSDNTLGE